MQKSDDRLLAQTLEGLVSLRGWASRTVSWRTHPFSLFLMRPLSERLLRNFELSGSITQKKSDVFLVLERSEYAVCDLRHGDVARERSNSYPTSALLGDAGVA